MKQQEDIHLWKSNRTCNRTSSRNIPPRICSKTFGNRSISRSSTKKNVVRTRPIPGDIVILLGGRTGRDGCGGATGSSKAHTSESLTTCGAEVQKRKCTRRKKNTKII